MLEVFATTLPFFALVLCGYIATCKAWLPLAAIPGLNTFILYFALPCLLFRFGAQTQIGHLLQASVFAVYTCAALLMVALALWFSQWVALKFGKGLNWRDRALGALVAAFPNTGFMGVPLLVALAGPDIAAVIIITITVDMVITSSLCVALANLDTPAQSFTHSLRNIVRSMLKNPMPWAILLGIAASALQVSLPTPAAKTLNMLADSASGVALFTIGAVIARTQMMAVINPAQNGTQSRIKATMPWFDYIPITVLKLFVHPALVWLLATAAQSLGPGLRDFDVTALTLVAALPSASNVSLLAEKMQANNGRIAYIILSTTALAFVSFSLVAHALL